MVKRSLLFCLLISMSAIVCFGQGAKPGEWIRIASDDGHFSVEVPAQYSFFFDERGFSISGARGNLPVKRMEMVNAVIDGSLVSFERYVGTKEALTRVYERDRLKKEVTENRELNDAGVKKREVTPETDKFFLIRQYFAHGDHIYVLTAASRDKETASMRRFLDSVMVRAKDEPAFPDGSVPFARLQPSTVQIEDLTGGEPPKAPLQSLAPVKKPEADEKPILFVLRPTPYYTEEARASRVTGNIKVKIAFDANGFTPKIAYLKTLTAGLSRQALFAALTLKFLPNEKNGTATTVVKTLEYNFNIF